MYVLVVIDPVPEQATAKAKIFISYSRRDLAFVDRLDAGLRAHGFEPLIDRGEIYAFEDWWDRIKTLIIKADTIVFVLSPDAVASEICAKEVDYAVSLSKRFAPVVCRRVDDRAVPEALQRLHFVFLDDEASFDDSIGQLAEALDTDIHWVRKHTEYGELAQRWVMAGRPGPRGLLLTSSVLEEAERWIASRPASAPPPTEATQAFIAESRRAATRRRKILSTSLGAGMAVALGLAGLALWQRGIAVEQRTIASQQRDTVLLQQSQFLAGLSRQQTETAHDPAAGLLLALEGLPDAGASDALSRTRPYWAGAEVSLEAARRALREMTVLRGHASQVSSVAMTADGRKVVTGSMDGTVRIWDAETGAVRRVFKGDGDPVRSVAVTPDGAHIVAGLGTSGERHHGAARVWNAETGAELLALGDQEFAVQGVAITATGDRAVTANTKLAILWDTKTGTELRQFKTDGGIGITSVAMTPDGRLIVAGLSADGARVWDANTGAEVANLEGHKGTILSVAVTADGRRVVTAAMTTGEDDDTARIWDVETGAQLRVLKGHANAVTSVAITPDGERVATASVDRTVRLWDAETGRELLVLGGHADPIWGVALSPDARHIVTAAGAAEYQSATGMGDNTARIWNAQVGHRVALQVDQQILAVAVTADGARVVAGQGEVQTYTTPDTFVTSAVSTVLDARTGEALLTLKGHTRSVVSVAVSPDGNRIATGSADRTARVWNALDGAELFRLDGHGGTVTGIAFLPGGTRIVTASADRTARLWDATSGAEALVLRGHTGSVTSVAAIPGGKRLVTGSRDKTARIWDAAAGYELLALRGHTDGITSVAPTPDGTRIVTGSGDGTARVWDSMTGRELLVLSGHEGAIIDVVVTPDGERIITAGGDDKTVRLWNARTGTPQAVLKRSGDDLAGIAAMPNGKGVVIAMYDRRDNLMRMHPSQIWPLLPTGQALIDEAKTIVPRCLLASQRQNYNLPPTPPDWCGKRQKWPYDADSLVLDIKRLLIEDKDRDALARSETAVALNPAISAKIDAVWAELLTDRGERLLVSKRTDEARSTLDEAIRWARRDAGLRSLQAAALVARGIALTASREFVDAQRDLQEAIALGNDFAREMLWSSLMQSSYSLLSEKPEKALLDAVTTSLDTTGSAAVSRTGEDADEWSRVVTLSVGSIHARLAGLQMTAPGVDETCDRLAANPYDPLRNGPGVAAAAVDAEQAIAACDRAAAAQPDEPRWRYQRGRARQIAANAAASRGEKAVAVAYNAAAGADFEAAMAAQYPMAFYNAALPADSSGDGRARDRAPPRLSEALNRVLYCCWAPVARHLLAEEELYGRPQVRRAVSEMTLWAAALGSSSARDLVAELAARGLVQPNTSLPDAALTDLPPWLRVNVPPQTR